MSNLIMKISNHTYKGLTKFFSTDEYYHWYQIKYSYRNPTGSNQEIFNWSGMKGFLHKKDIINPRKVKKHIKPFSEDLPKNARHLLCNGYIEYEVISYLGYFKEQDK